MIETHCRTRREGSCRGRLVSLILAGLAPGLVAAPALAQDWGGSLGFGSDNVYRGISLTAARPAWMLDAHRGIGAHWVAGLSAAAERPLRQAAGAQLTLYLQRGWRLDDGWSMQLGFLHHESPWNDYRRQLRYDEASLAFDFRGRFQLTLATSPNHAGYYPQHDSDRGTASWFEAGYQQPLRGRLSANFGLGQALFQRSGLKDYRYGNIGLNYAVGRTYFYLSWLWSDLDNAYYQRIGLSGSRWTGSVVWTFP